MSYRASSSLADLVDPDLIDDAADRMAKRTGEEMLAEMRERTPVADPVKIPGDTRKPRARKPGTARASWHATPVEERGEHRQVSAESEDPIVDFLDRGTPPHVIRRKTAGSLAFPETEGGGGVVLRASVQHPGTEPLAIVDRGLAATETDFERVGREETERWAREQSR